VTHVANIPVLGDADYVLKMQKKHLWYSASTPLQYGATFRRPFKAYLGVLQCESIRFK
jgi:hypothetical protein